MLRRSLFLLLALLLLSPCSANADDFWPAVKDYFRDRGNDLADIFWFQGGAAATYKTVGLHLRVSKFFQFGYLRFEGYKAGTEGRAFLVTKEKKVQRGTAFICPDTEIVQEPILVLNDEHSKRPVVRNGWFKGDDGKDLPWSLAAEVALPPSSFDLDFGFCPEQVFDFLIGVFRFDPMGDDNLPCGPDPNEWFYEETQ